MRIRPEPVDATQPHQQECRRETWQCHHRERLSPCRNGVIAGSGSEAAAATAAPASLEHALGRPLDRQGGGLAAKYHPRMNEDMPRCSNAHSPTSRLCLSAVMSPPHTSLTRRAVCAVPTGRRLDHTDSGGRRRLYRSATRPSTGGAVARFSPSQQPRPARPSAPRSGASPNRASPSPVSEHGTWE
jgi:hypothetical protein